MSFWNFVLNWGYYLLKKYEYEYCMYKRWCFELFFSIKFFGLKINIINERIIDLIFINLVFDEEIFIIMSLMVM